MRRRVRDERGATMLMVAAALLLLLGVAAIVVDLGGLRFDMRADRLATDASATAGAAAINPFANSAADVACEDAWDYLLLNLEDEGSTVSPPTCSTFATTCDPSVARQESGSAGPYAVTFTHPVPDGHPLMDGQDLNLQFDGTPCQRFGVEVNRARDFTFAAAIGFDSGDTTVRSVARIGPGRGEGEVVPLLLLEPISCDALYTSGQGGITVTSYEDSPGFIVVDSAGSKSTQPNRCDSNSWTIDAKGNTNGWIRALPTAEGIPSAILSYALSRLPGTQPNRSHDPNDLTTPVATCLTGPPESCYRLYPQPQSVPRRITRAPIDWRYNCKTGYDPYPLDLDDPGVGTIPIEDCPKVGDPGFGPFIDELVAAYDGTTPLGWLNEVSGAACSPTVNQTYSRGDWYVNCPSGYIVNGVDVVFEGGGDVVFEGAIDLRSSGTLTINADDDEDHVVYVRAGNLLKGAQSSITLNRTLVYLESGVVDLVGGSGGLVWDAPEGGNFDDLALWSESPDSHQIGGQAGNTLTGTFFTPMARPFVLTGQGGQFQTDAQFLTRRLEVKGQGEVLMTPDPDRQTHIPIREVFLIR